MDDKNTVLGSPAPISHGMERAQWLRCQMLHRLRLRHALKVVSRVALCSEEHYQRTANPQLS